MRVSFDDVHTRYVRWYVYCCDDVFLLLLDAYVLLVPGTTGSTLQVLFLH